MKNFFTALKLENIKKHLTEVIQRFPISTIIIVTFCILLLVETHYTSLPSDIGKQITRGAFTLVVTFFLSVGTYIATENFNISRTKENLKSSDVVIPAKAELVPSRRIAGLQEIYLLSKNPSFKKQLYQLFPITFGILFFWSFSPNLDNFENFILFLISLVGIIGFIFFAPYIRDILTNKGKQEVYYTYFFNISVIFLWGFILGGVLFLLGIIAIGAVITLFDLQGVYTEKLYIDWAIFSLSFVTPLFALTKFPNEKACQKEDLTENAFFSFLVKYIAIPFIFVYFIILYAYTVKVLINFGNWPKGEISWLVIGFSTFGYATYMFSFIFEERTKAIKFFRKYFPYAVIPQLAMLFYAIYLRINQYDITINRYFVVVFGIWLLLISLYYIVSKLKYLGFVPVLLTIFTIIISIGPWSVYQLPEGRQLSRLKTELIQANILQKGEIIPLKSITTIDPKLSGEIYSGISYLCNLNDCQSIKTLFPTQYSEAEKKDKAEQARYNPNLKTYPPINSWTIINSITEAIKVQPYYASQQEPSSLSFYVDGKTSFFPISTKGYDQLLRIDNGNESGNTFYATVDEKLGVLYIKKGSATLDSIDIKGIINNFTARYKRYKQTNIPSDDMTFTLKGTKYETEIFFENLNFPNPNYTEKINEIQTTYANTSGYLLIRNVSTTK